ncbi:thymidylate synthase [Candidatus Dojkabacteria bacterium]|nr:thymidylate synthase [Candidatus Dojkabacteria bacterium]
MKEYHKLINDVLNKGRTKGDRSGFWLRSTFGHISRYDLSKGFPVVTTRKMPLRWLKHELLWFLSGDCTNTKYLEEHKVHLWDSFAYNVTETENYKFEPGELGPMYGYQWRKWPKYDGKGHVDQIKRAIKMIKEDPYSKAIIVSAWNAAQIDEMRLPPCHTFFQFYVRKDELSMLMYQRAGDVFIGVPFNISEYALLLSMVAHVTNKKPKEFVHVIGDAHIYKNHKDAALEQLKRKPYPLPKLWLNPEIKDIDDFTIKDIKIKGYKHHPKLNMPVVVV